MVTKEQALTAQEFHYGECIKHIGPRGGVRIHRDSWRRNGRTQTWVTRPNEFRIPIKWGLRECGSITQSNAQLWHAAEDCPLNKEEVA